MTLPFNESVVNDLFDSNSFRNPNFLGYLDKNGNPIRFEDRYGYRGHGEGASVQQRFRVLFNLKIADSENISAIDEYRMSKKFLISEKKRYLNIIKKYLEDLKDYPIRDDDNSKYNYQLEQDIYKFLLNCYSAETFFDGIGNIRYCMCEHDFYDVYYKKNHPGSSYYGNNYDFELEYSIYKDKILVDILKEVVIQYLGYHSVERIPKTITTSEPNIYETFYNYLLNDFEIFKLPRMNYDSKEKRYIEHEYNEFFISDKELRLKEEINSIKKLVPLKERSKYYR